MVTGRPSLIQKGSKIVHRNNMPSIHSFLDHVSVYNVPTLNRDQSKLKPSELKLFLDKLPKAKDSRPEKIELVSFEFPSVFVPKKHFHSKNASHYISTYCPSDSIYSTRYKELNSVGLLNVFHFNESIASQIKKKGYIPFYKHYYSDLFELTQKYLMSNKQKYKIFLFFYENWFDIFTFSESKFMGANRFNINDSDEFTYYFLSFVKSSGMKLSNLKVFPIDRFTRYDSYYDVLQNLCELEFIQIPNHRIKIDKGTLYNWNLFL